MSYIQVAEEEGVDPIEVPTEDDENNSILLSTLTSLFAGASGLKFKNPETGTIRGIRLIGGRLQPPEEGWKITPVYYCAFIKDNKRKSKSQNTTPNSKIKKTEDNKSQQKDSSKKRKLSDEERAKREEEKLKREEERAKREAQKEEERIRKEEEKARKEALKEEDRIRKEEEKARKEEERAKREALKEEERVRKEAEKALKDEEKARKEAQKEVEKQKLSQKEEKQKNILRNFFIKKSFDETFHKKKTTNAETTANGLFLPFQLCENQTIAQIVPEIAKKRFNRQELDRLLDSQNSNKLYLDLLKTIEFKPLSKRVDRNEPEIIIESQTEEEDDNQTKRYRVKRLQFHENVRPPYRGTYRKKSTKLKPTKPFNKDTDLFDYEVDSDEEWDEGGPGESLDGSDSDGSVKDDYEIDNEFFVPHGYLSEDENDENEDKMQVIVENDETNDQKEKHQPLLKEQVLMAERNRSFASNLKPLVLGCVWESNPNKNNKLFECLLYYKRMSISTK